MGEAAWGHCHWDGEAEQMGERIAKGREGTGTAAVGSRWMRGGSFERDGGAQQWGRAGC